MFHVTPMTSTHPPPVITLRECKSKHLILKMELQTWSALISGYNSPLLRCGHQKKNSTCLFVLHFDVFWKWKSYINKWRCNASPCAKPRHVPNSLVHFAFLRVQCYTCLVDSSDCHSLPTSLFSFRLPVIARVHTRQSCDADARFPRVFFSEALNAELYLSELSGHVMWHLKACMPS